jgi:hypothetical protein
MRILKAYRLEIAIAFFGLQGVPAAWAVSLSISDAVGDAGGAPNRYTDGTTRTFPLQGKRCEQIAISSDGTLGGWLDVGDLELVNGAGQAPDVYEDARRAPFVLMQGDRPPRTIYADFPPIWRWKFAAGKRR